MPPRRSRQSSAEFETEAPAALAEEDGGNRLPRWKGPPIIYPRRTCADCGRQARKGAWGGKDTCHSNSWFCASCWHDWEQQPASEGQTCPSSSSQGHAAVQKVDRNKGYRGIIYNGSVYLPFIRPATVDRLRESAELRRQDVIVVTFPRSGTTWVQQICLGLLLEGGPRDIKNPTRQAPWIEASMCRGFLSIEDLQAGESEDEDCGCKRRVFKTHATASLAPWKDRRGARIIFVERDPRDVCVSYFHHMRDSKAYHYEGEWPDFMEMFLDGEVEGGDWWTWHREWREATAGLPPDEVLWMRYEELKVDLRGQVDRINDFIEADANEDRLQEAADSATFEAMQGAMQRRNKVRAKNGVTVNPRFIRRGESGTWREVMTEADSERFLSRLTTAFPSVHG